MISPVLANLFLHYAFDEWMKRHHGKVPFERYADDIICHWQSQAQAEALMEHVRARLAECGLELNPQKSKVVYCADAKRRGSYKTRQFDFLGYTFKPRTAMDKQGVVFTNFAPAVADKAAVAMRQEMQSWGAGAAQPVGPGRSAGSDTACGDGMGGVLRTVLSLETVSSVADAGPALGAVGPAKVQGACPTHGTRVELAGGVESPTAAVISALVRIDHDDWTVGAG